MKKNYAQAKGVQYCNFGLLHSMILNSKQANNQLLSWIVNTVWLLTASLTFMSLRTLAHKQVQVVGQTIHMISSSLHPILTCNYTTSNVLIDLPGDQATTGNLKGDLWKLSLINAHLIWCPSRDVHQEIEEDGSKLAWLNRDSIIHSN